MKPLTILPLLILLFACGPQLQRPRVDQATIESERTGQIESALKLVMDRSEQLMRVAGYVNTRGAELCGNAVEPIYGVLFLDRDSFPKESRTAAARIFNLGEEPQIRYLVSELPAADAGLRPGDRVLKLKDIPVSTLTSGLFQPSKAEQ